jgi:hypothetical protein
VYRAIALRDSSADCHLFEGYTGLILRFAAPVFTPQLPVLRNNRKLLGRPCNRFESRSIFCRPAAQDPSKACFGPKFSKNSLFLGWRPVSLDCFRHHPVLRNRKSLRRLGIGRFCEDFRPVSFRSFDLRWRLRSSGRFGLRPKIPFSTAGSSTPDRVRLPGFLGFGRPKATFRTRSAIIADSIQGLRTAGSILAEHREVARLRCRVANDLRRRPARELVQGTRVRSSC